MILYLNLTVTEIKFSYCFNFSNQTKFDLVQTAIYFSDKASVSKSVNLKPILASRGIYRE